MGTAGLDQGAVFAGRYRVVRSIASGGMGSVYEVVHLETDRRRALKTMHADLVSSTELRRRFQREARVCANVSSEFIVEVFDAGVDEATGMPFLVMELLAGEELGKRLLRTGPVAPEDVVTWLGQVASALDKTHAAGIVHRDLKPENLFLTRRDDGSARVKILDFGISKVIDKGSPGANVTTKLGSPLYMAPEQVTAEPLGPATDTYALGLIAYTLLVGEPYWQKEAEELESLVAFAMKSAQGPEESPVLRAERRGVRLPVGFDVWFRRATAREPSRRFQSAGALVAALAEVLDQPMATEPHAARPVSTVPTIPVDSGALASWTDSGSTARSRAWALGLAATAALLAIVAAYVLVVSKRAAPSTITSAEPPVQSSPATAPERSEVLAPVPTASVPEPPTAVTAAASALAVSASPPSSAGPRPTRPSAGNPRPHGAPASSTLRQPQYTRD